MLTSRQALLSVAILFSPAVFAANQCVNPRGVNGCWSSINDAIGAAGPNETVTVAPGTYAEDDVIVIDKPLALIGDGSSNTTIDAMGLANGIDVDGYNHPGLGHVVVSGFTVANANFQGILVTNASDVTISHNHLTGNDRSLQPFHAGGPICPGLPDYFVAGEGFDCGEGIHLSGVTFSTVSDNQVDHNAGGILVSDDTGPNHDNLITGNTVQDNPYDCGITLASHHFAVGVVDPTVGVYHITVAGNTSSRNGLQTGEGAGVGIFAGPPGAQNWGDVIVDNVLTGNGLPGVTMHSHFAFQNLNDHLISGNTISGNGPDSDPGVTVPTGIVVFNDETVPPPLEPPVPLPAPPITGVNIVGNTFGAESIDVAVATSGSVGVHQNDFSGSIGIENLGSGEVNATMNWWKCSGGPDAHGCASVSGDDVQTAPWLTRPAQSAR